MYLCGLYQLVESGGFEMLIIAMILNDIKINLIPTGAFGSTVDSLESYILALNFDDP